MAQKALAKTLKEDSADHDGYAGFSGLGLPAKTASFTKPRSVLSFIWIYFLLDSFRTSNFDSFVYHDIQAVVSYHWGAAVPSPLVLPVSSF